MVLDNPFVRYASMTPHALALQLEEIVRMADFESLSSKAAASVASDSWDAAGQAVDTALRRLLEV
jgi:hypothetical protein